MVDPDIKNSSDPRNNSSSSSRRTGRTRPFVETRPEGSVSEFETEGYEASDDDGVVEQIRRQHEKKKQQELDEQQRFTEDNTSQVTSLASEESDSTTRVGLSSSSPQNVQQQQASSSNNRETSSDTNQQEAGSTKDQPESSSKDQPKKSNPNMTVETETVPAVPTVAVTPATVNPTSSLKMKKSTDNVPSKPSSNRAKKKKSTRQGMGSKAEVFAAKIASAVDEAQSSDSDETFVYESNPTDPPPPVTKERPRFQHRNLSSSSLSRPQIDSNAKKSKQPQQHQQSASQSTSQQQQQPSASSIQSESSSASLFIPATSSSAYPTNQHQPNTQSSSSGGHGTHNSNMVFSSTDSNNEASVVAPTASKRGATPRLPSSSRLSTNSPRRGGGGGGGVTGSSSYGTNNNSNSSSAVDKSPYLRPKSSRYFDSSTNKNASAYNKRWRGGGYDEEDDGYGDDDAEGDVEDVDDYLEYSETTPLRSAGQSIRRARKNGGIVVYSPHNYQRGRQRSKYYYVRLALWAAFGIICLLAAGFVFGFLLATTKPLHDVEIENIFDVLISDDVLEFNMAVEAVNPGFLAIDMSDANLDVFAKSPYVREELATNLDSDDDSGGGGSHTMLLGTISQFNAPITFEGGVFSRELQRTVGDVKLKSPGKNTTLDDIDDAYDGNGGEDDDLDEGQRRWVRVSGHPFELIVRGVLEYNLVLGRGARTVSVAKTVHIDPNADVL